jgi:Rab3 GTPase-activating protein catalytic subunit
MRHAKNVIFFIENSNYKLMYAHQYLSLIFRVAPGFPDSRTCLLHQKLQMLNICMDRRRVREGGLPFSMTTAAAATSDETGRDSESEEFFDLSDNDEGKRKAGFFLFVSIHFQSNALQDSSKFKHELWNEPIGRLSRLGKMLLVDTDEPVYIPITQEPVPKTEDELEDDAEVMLKLGPGSELRTQMMSASLLSDMESFKAANPSGKFEDFIRWYSPRDWMEDDADGERKIVMFSLLLIKSVEFFV